MNNPENMLKGRMAETLVAEILHEAGNQVYRFGYESILQNLTQVKNVFDRHSEVGEKIRSIPDFLVISKAGEPFFVEVKFRWNQEWHENDHEMLRRLNSFWKPIIIFVNCYKEPYFLLTKPPYHDKNEKLEGVSLIETNDFGVTKDIVEKYDKLVEKYLSPMLNPDKKT